MMLSDNQHDDMSQHNHRIRTVAKFREAFNTANDSDITLHWFNYSINISANGYTSWTRIFMHCVAMLSDHKHHLVEVHLSSLDNFEYRFAKAFLSGSESSIRSQRLVTVECGGTSNTEASSSSSDFDTALSLYNIGCNDPYLRFGSSFPSLSNIDFQNTGRPDLDALPS